MTSKQPHKIVQIHMGHPVQACFTTWMAIATSLLQTIKKINPWKFGEKKSQLTVIQHLLKVTNDSPIDYKKDMVWILFILNYSFTKHSGIDPCEKRINIPGGHAWRYFFMTCSKLEAMATYLVKQAWGNDIMACSKEELSQ